jgi:aryl-alcohol dehydrogenase-like predicted oxidoreductase
MEYRLFGEHEISALVLGTVQFGLDYGVANTTGRPSQETVNRMLATAFDAGVNTLDTASMYNQAESVLGRALGDLGMRDRIFICSKARPHEEASGTPEEQITAAVERSLRVLGVERIGLYLLHGYHAFPFVGALHRKREAGDIGAVGVSVYSVEEALDAIATPGIDAIQHPVSVLDQRFLRSGVLDRAAEAGVAIFARSVYLQGVVTMAISELPAPMAELGRILTGLRELAGDLTIEELALRYVASISGVTGVVVGMETHEQMERNLAAVLAGPLDGRLLEAIGEEVPDLPDDIINPGHWRWIRDYDWGKR